jgi:uncharacterized damage-inducible protein DinB
MAVIGYLAREFVYNAWANRESLRSLLAAKAVPARAAEVIAHIVGAEWLWLKRLGQSSPDLPVWPALSLHDCDAQLKALASAWKDLLRSTTDESLSQKIAYTNSKGEQWTNTVADVLTHVALHSSYHRGQIASLLGRAGETAAYSDYIECVRRGHLESE